MMKMIMFLLLIVQTFTSLYFVINVVMNRHVIAIDVIILLIDKAMINNVLRAAKTRSCIDMNASLWLST